MDSLLLPTTKQLCHFCLLRRDKEMRKDTANNSPQTGHTPLFNLSNLPLSATQSIRGPLGQSLQSQLWNSFKDHIHFLGISHVFFHYTWHESIETPTGLENIKHGLIPDRSGNSPSEIFLATTIHGFHQGLQHPERFPSHFPTLAALKEKHAKPLQLMFLSALSIITQYC